MYFPFQFHFIKPDRPSQNAQVRAAAAEGETSTLGAADISAEILVRAGIMPALEMHLKMVARINIPIAR